MKIGVLVTSIGNFGAKGFYNSQEIGLAKELSKIFDSVMVWRAVSSKNALSVTSIEGCPNAIYHLVPTKQYGANGMIDVATLDVSIDILVYFSDNQLAVPRVYNWCQKNKIKFIPYVGVTESHSNGKFVRGLMGVLFRRNISIYKRHTCLAKTPHVKEALKKYGVHNCIMAPVGLDLSLLHANYMNTPVAELKEKWGFSTNDRVLLYIGRLTPEKQPTKVVEIFNSIYKKDSRFRLLIIGKGELYDNVIKIIIDKGIQDVVCLVDKVPNADIWELYHIAEAFINLNQQEIFGMAILEAIYYGCKVIAQHAPGPDFIIEDGVSGVLCSSSHEIEEAIINSQIDKNSAKERVLGSFTWKITADKIWKLVR